MQSPKTHWSFDSPDVAEGASSRTHIPGAAAVALHEQLVSVKRQPAGDGVGSATCVVCVTQSCAERPHGMLDPEAGPVGCRAVRVLHFVRTHMSVPLRDGQVVHGLESEKEEGREIESDS